MSPDAAPSSGPRRFDRLELAGSFGDLGTFLPIVVAMILVNGLSPSAVLLAFGLFYIGTGLFYRLPVPVQPLKAVGAIAIANPAIVTMPTIAAAGILFGAVMLALWGLRLVDLAARLFAELENLRHVSPSSLCVFRMRWCDVQRCDASRARQAGRRRATS